MKVRITVFFLFVSLMASAQGEPSFSVILPDTVATGSQFRIEFKLENAEAQSRFELPEIQGLKILGGPNMSSSYMFNNGLSSKATTYTYFAMAEREDQIRIPVQVIETDNGLLTAEARILEAVDGYEPTRKEESRSPFDSFFGGRDLFESEVPPIFPERKESQKRRRRNKRKVYRI